MNIKMGLLSAIFLVFTLAINAQEVPKDIANFELGNGLTFNFDDNYHFKLGGMLQPYVGFQQLENQEADYFLNAKRTYFNFSGKAVKEKVSFFLQTDFSLNDPLLDAWIGYKPFAFLNITFGQKQNIANNREMLIMEDKLQFTDRGLLSNTYSLSGREFGLFIESAFGSEKFEIQPQFAITSGDGRNSFGSDSRDVDLGGLKYAARINLFPLGNFSEGNHDLIADLMHEEKIKIALGAAASYNDGASNPVGEGHGNFFIYDGLGDVQLPDYQQVYSDILIKYKGISLLGEYVVATATELQGSYTNEAGTVALVPTEISQYLSLGTGYNAQLGYVTKSGYAIDFRMEQITPEFGDNQNTIITETDALAIGFAKYFKGNDLKLQATYSQTNFSNNTNLIYGGITCQVVF